MSDLDEAVKLGLEDPELFINRANVWHSLGNDEHALSEVNRAIEAAPENALAFNNRALIWASLGNLDESLSDANEAIRLDPEYADAFNNRGVTRVKRGEFEAAVDDYDRAIKLNPEFRPGVRQPRLCGEATRSRMLRRSQDYRHAVELAPESPQAFNDAAWLVATCPDKEIRDGAGRPVCEIRLRADGTTRTASSSTRWRPPMRPKGSFPKRSRHSSRPSRYCPRRPRPEHASD